MSRKSIYFLIAGLALAQISNAQFRRVDTTAKLGDVGYHVICNNKKTDVNSLYIAPIGFKNTAHPAYFNLKGRISQIAVDDLNDDGFPDLLVFVYTGDSSILGNVVGVASSNNDEMLPVYFPDIYNDPKLREGYKGHDEFKVMVGSLLRTFPIYKPGDTDIPTGGKRVIQYKIVPGERGGLTFKALRSYEKQDN